MINGVKYFNIPGTKLLQLFFHWASSAFEDFREEPEIHLNPGVMNLLLTYALKRFVELIKMKETVILLDVEAVNKTKCPGARGTHSDCIFNHREITVAIRTWRNHPLTAL